MDELEELDEILKAKWIELRQTHRSTETKHWLMMREMIENRESLISMLSAGGNIELLLMDLLAVAMDQVAMDCM